MKILITNNALSNRSGSELYVQEVARELIKRGHDVIAYSNVCGKLAREMNKAGITTINDLNKIPKEWTPDVIHGQHHLEAMTAIVHFPSVPAVYICHGWRPWQEKVPKHPRITKYAAVDLKTLEFTAKTANLPKNKIKLFHNFVDLERFKQRKPLPQKPKKALVFSNYANENNYLVQVRQACEKAKLKLNVVGLGTGRPIEEPEKILGSYDLIFAVGRSALESLATGAAVIICGEMGVGPMVSVENMEKLRDLNFGVGAMYSEPNADKIYQEICRYNSKDATTVTERLRKKIGINLAVDKIEVLYKEAVDIYSGKKTVNSLELSALSDYIRQISSFIKDKEHQQNVELVQSWQENRRLFEKNKIEQTKLTQTIIEKDQKESELNLELQKKDREIENMKASKFWKMREIYWKIKKKFLA